MRSLTSKEKKLLAWLLGTLFLLLNVVGLRVFLDRQRALKKDIATLQEQLAANNAVLAEQPVYEERGEWLDRNQPADDISTTEDDAKFYEFVESSAKRSGLEYTRKAGGPLPPTGDYVEVFDSSQVKGTLESVVKWLSELQQPKAFRAIKQLTIKSGEPPQLVCDVEVARWYRPAEGDKQ